MTDPVSTGNNNASTLTGALPSGKNLTMAAVLAALLGAGGFGGVYTYIGTLGTWPNGQFRALDTALILGQPPAKVATSGSYNDLINTPNFSSFFNTPAPAGQFSTGFTGGLPSFAQVAFSNLGGTAAAEQVPFAIQRSGDNFGAGTLGFPLIPASQDLTYAGTTTDPNAIKLGAGNSISFCPLLSCVNTGAGGTSPNPAFYDHQRATAFLSATTQIDAQAEEQTLGITTVVNKGFTKAWVASTAYNVGDNVQSGNAIYRVTVAGTTSAASSNPLPTTRPSSAPFSISDGGVTFLWINDGAINAKLGLYNEVDVQAGAGPAWAAAFNFHLEPGMTPSFQTNLELDFQNNAGTCNIGAANCTGQAISMTGGYTSTQGQLIDGNNSGNYSVIWAQRFSGAMLSSNADIEIETGSPNGIAFNGFGTPTAHNNAAIFDASLGPYSILNTAAKTTAAFADQSNSRATLFSSGSHSAGDIVLNTTSPNSILFQGSQHTTSISDTSAGAYGYQNIANKTTAAFADQSNSNAVLFGSGAHAAGDIVLNTSSPTSFLSQGSHTNGIQLKGSYSQYAISSPGYAVTGAGATIQTTANLTPVAVANLPTCNAAAEGTFAAVNDLSGTLAYNGAVAGGGSTHIPVYCNGTTWTQH